MLNKDRQYNVLELEDTKGIIRSRKSKTDRQHNGLQLEDAKGIIRSRKSKDRQLEHCIVCPSLTYGF
jgi:hypothetical protein